MMKKPKKKLPLFLLSLICVSAFLYLFISRQNLVAATECARHLAFRSRTAANSRIPILESDDVDVSSEQAVALRPSEQYFLSYQAYSGFSNQLQELDNALRLAIILNRTVVVSDIVISYHLDGQEGKKLPITEYLNLEQLSQVAPLVRRRDFKETPTMLSLDVPHTKIDTIWVDHLPTCKNCTEKIRLNELRSEFPNRKIRGVLDMFGNSPVHNLHFTRLQGNELVVFLNPDRDQEVSRLIAERFVFQDRLQQVADKIVKALGSFSAVHLRRGDFLEYYDPETNDPFTVADNIRVLLNPGEKLYIATDEKDAEALAPFKRFFPTFTLRDFEQILKENFIESNFFLVVDQLVSTKGRVFISSGPSTLSGNVRVTREVLYRKGMTQLDLRRYFTHFTYLKAGPGHYMVTQEFDWYTRKKKGAVYVPI